MESDPTGGVDPADLAAMLARAAAALDQLAIRTAAQGVVLNAILRVVNQDSQTHWHSMLDKVLGASLRHIADTAPADLGDIEHLERQAVAHYVIEIIETAKTKILVKETAGPAVN